MDKITLKAPYDMHLHLRDADMLKLVGPMTSESFAGAIVMPNLQPPVTTKQLVLEYRARVMEAVKDENFNPLMTVFYSKDFDVDVLEDIKDDITAVKFYPAGATTNSDDGLSGVDVEAMRPVLERMGELGIPLLFHGESNGFVMDREYEFLPVWETLAKEFPKLKILMEHISDRRTLDLLDKYPNLYATVTIHHLLFTLDDVIGGMMEPHMFCKPVIKTPADRDAIQKAVLSGHPKIMFGSDSAPHPKPNKERTGASAGVFTAPITLPLLVEFFEEHGKLDLLQAFVSDNAVRIYNLPQNQKEVTLVKKESVVPKSYEGFGQEVVPMYCGKKLKWSIV
jgi:dihydroorotase